MEIFGSIAKAAPWLVKAPAWLVSHFPDGWKPPAMRISVPNTLREGVPNPSVRISREEAAIKVQVDLWLQLESDEHQRTIAIRSAEIELRRWRNPFGIVRIPSECSTEGRVRKHWKNGPLTIGPLGDFKGWFVHRAFLPMKCFPTDWRSTLVIGFRGARRMRQPLKIDWDAPLDAWNRLLEHEISKTEDADDKRP